jgi:Cu/Ag efflux pump CusA
MLKAIIEFSLRNRALVLLATVALAIGGIFALRNLPIDAIPDLSDTQVIIYTEWPGQAPQIVQDQVTYPITTKMLSVPNARVVRGIRSTASHSSISSSMTAPIPTGRAVGCWNTSARSVANSRQG